jgi:hypothetical protein
MAVVISVGVMMNHRMSELSKKRGGRTKLPN